MSEPLLVFFDTFSVEEQSKNRLNYVRFSTCIELSEIRIIPFGSVIESRLSDEAIIGATNPPSFNVKFFGYSQPTAATLSLIMDHNYNEVSGIDVIKLPNPMPTTFLLLQGNYSSITIAVFGLPFLVQLPPSSLSAPIFSIPPPHIVQPLTDVIPSSHGHNISLHSRIDDQFRNTELHRPTISSSCLLQASSDTKQVGHIMLENQCDIGNPTKMNASEIPKRTNETGALFEDGEIQDMEYDVISSNDDLFSDGEEQETNSQLANKNRISVPDSNDPLLEQYRWQFDPFSFPKISPDSLPGLKRRRLPDPTLTIFETYCWLFSLNNNEKEESILLKGDEESSEDVGFLSPPVPDIVQAKQDADFLLNASDEFGIDAIKFDSSWVLTIEKLADVLPSGLAYLALHETDAYDFVVTCLLVWTYAGLDLDSALSQSDPTFILRHLRAGIELAGLIMSTTCDEVCLKFLHSESDQWHLKQTSNVLPSAFQAQQILLNLLESPIMATPLRVTIMEALERSTRLTVGINAFLGVAEVKQEEIGQEKEDVIPLDKKGRQLTPYQRLMLIMKTNKSTHVSVACQRLITKAHTLDLLTDFDSFMDRLKTSETHSDDSDPELEGQLHGFLVEIQCLLTNADKIISTPNNSLMSAAGSKKERLSDPYPTVYRLLISTHFLDNLVWMLEDTETPAISICRADVFGCIRALIGRSSGLLVLASQPASLISRLVNRLFQHSSTSLPDQQEEGDENDLELGLELATKLEALSHIDQLISISRKKGITGFRAYICERVHKELENGENGVEQESQGDALFEGLFGLARLFITPGHSAVNLSPWVAELLASEDYFLPCLMLLEAYKDYSEAPEGEISEKQSARHKHLPLHHRRGLRGLNFIARLGYSSSHLEVASLLATLSVGLLRYASDVTYLERFGSRLLKLIQTSSWAESVTSLSPAIVFSHYRRFNEVAFPWIGWLLDAPAPGLFCSFPVLSEESIGWLIDQVGPMGEELEKSLDQLITLDFADDLLSTSRHTTNHSTHSLPLSMLLLLRLLKAQISPPHEMEESCSLPLPFCLLARQQALLELFTRIGLTGVCSLIDCLTDHLLMVSQLPQPSCSPEPAVVEMLALGVEIVAQLINSLCLTPGAEFRDMTPLRYLFRAFAATVYLQSLPPTPSASILRANCARIRKVVLKSISAYSTASQTSTDSKNDLEKSLWLRVCKQLLSFTASSPTFFLPGLHLLLALLPLPLPLHTLRPLSVSEQKEFLAYRDWWCRHLLHLPVELCGLVELLSSSPNSSPVASALDCLVHRLTDLGPSIALLLVNSTLETVLDLFSVASASPKYTEAGLEQTGQDDNSTEAASDNSSGVPDLMKLGHFSMGTKLILGPQFIGLPSSEQSQSGEGSTEAHAVSSWKPFNEIADSQEISHSLRLLRVILRQPVCKQAFLHLLRESLSSAKSPVRSKTVQPPSGAAGDTAVPVSKTNRLLAIFANILEVCTDSKPHMAAQSLLIECIGLLLDPTLGMKGESGEEEDDFFCLANHLPPAFCLREIVASLMAHLNHPDRDISSIPPVLAILYRLSVNDYGFSILHSQLNLKRNDQVLANVMQRVNDSFSADNPDCLATLGLMLRLISALLGDAIFAEEVNFASGSCLSLLPTYSLSTDRELRLSGLRLRHLLRWTGTESGVAGNPVRDLTSLLELLAEDEIVLKPLQDGMKSLLQLLSDGSGEGVREATVDESETIRKLHGGALEHTPQLPLPQTLDYFYSFLPVFLVVSREMHSRQSLLLLLSVARSLKCPSGKVVKSELKMVNLEELMDQVCPGLELRRELFYCVGRRRHAEQPEATTQHQKRRKGQSSIIETGRSSQKYVAPMRGRGFMIRNSGGASQQGGGTSSIGLSSAGGASGASLLGPAGGSNHSGSAPSLLGLGGLGGSCHRPDIFRSRPQNTSRPPSLHVDDFNKLEKDDHSMGGAGTSASGGSNERNFGRDDNLRFRGFRDNRSFRGRGGGNTGTSAGGLLSSNLASLGGGLSNIVPSSGSSSASSAAVMAFRQHQQGTSGGQRVLSTLPFVGSASSGQSAIPPLPLAAPLAANLLPNWANLELLQTLTSQNRSCQQNNNMSLPRHD